MARITIGLLCGLALAGCQAQNPYALFGPNRVPSPGMQSPAPYYPPAANAAATPPASGAAASAARPSVSVNSPTASPTTIPNSAQGEQPIRIVENEDAAVRTATAPGSRSGGSSPAPSAPTRDKSSKLPGTSAVIPASYEPPAAAGQWKSR